MTLTTVESASRVEVLHAVGRAGENLDEARGVLADDLTADLLRCRSHLLPPAGALDGSLKV